MQVFGEVFDIKGIGRICELGIVFFLFFESGYTLSEEWNDR
jgi:hypothetical protein